MSAEIQAFSSYQGNHSPSIIREIASTSELISLKITLESEILPWCLITRLISGTATQKVEDFAFPAAMDYCSSIIPAIPVPKDITFRIILVWCVR